jgi:glc operon protein GlcG
MNRKGIVRGMRWGAVLVLLGISVLAADEPAAGPSLLERGKVGLTLPAARLVLGASEAKAKEMGLKVNLCVVDEGGHPISFARMDGARPASSYTAMTKATAAATMRQPTGPLPPGTKEPEPLLNLSFQLTAAAGGAKVTTLYGGVPIVIDGQVVGAVGVGGATGEQDAEIARAGIAALLVAAGVEGDAAPASGAKP